MEEDYRLNRFWVLRLNNSLRKGALLSCILRIIRPSLESREYWAEEDSSPYTLAEAFVMRWLPMKLIGNFYLNFNKPPRPKRIFTNRDEAAEWLKTFL